MNVRWWWGESHVCLTRMAILPPLSLGLGFPICTSAGCLSLQFQAPIPPAPSPAKREGLFLTQFSPKSQRPVSLVHSRSIRASLLGPRFSRVEVTLAWRGEGWPRDGFCDLGHHDLWWDVGAAKGQLGLCQADASQQEACPAPPQDQRLVTPCQPVLLCTG